MAPTDRRDPSGSRDPIDLATARDPHAPSSSLMVLAGTRPELRPQIIGNPACPPELREWITRLEAADGAAADPAPAAPGPVEDSLAPFGWEPSDPGLDDEPFGSVLGDPLMGSPLFDVIPSWQETTGTAGATGPAGTTEAADGDRGADRGHGAARAGAARAEAPSSRQAPPGAASGRGPAPGGAQPHRGGYEPPAPPGPAAGFPGPPPAGAQPAIRQAPPHPIGPPPGGQYAPWGPQPPAAMAPSGPTLGALMQRAVGPGAAGPADGSMRARGAQ